MTLESRRVLAGTAKARGLSGNKQSSAGASPLIGLQILLPGLLRFFLALGNVADTGKAHPRAVAYSAANALELTVIGLVETLEPRNLHI